MAEFAAVVTEGAILSSHTFFLIVQKEGMKAFVTLPPGNAMLYKNLVTSLFYQQSFSAFSPPTS